MKPLIIARDLGGAEWVEFSEVIVASRGWLEREYGPKGPCRCAGTGVYTAVVTLADAVLLDERPCPAGCPIATTRPADAPCHEETRHGRP